MKKILSGAMVLVSTLIFAGCAKTAVPSQTDQTAAQTTQATPSLAAGDKVGTTTKTGKVTKVGNSYLLQSGNQSTGIDSYSIDLSQYAGQQVTVSGEYSGDTLFVTKVN